MSAGPAIRPLTTTQGGAHRLNLQKRSTAYLAQLAKLDHGTLPGTRGWDELLAAVQAEFGDAALSEVPLGIVSKCFLGAPYEVHTLDLGARSIVQHYKTGEPLPGDFEKARALARHNAYALVEVYAGKLLLIAADGSVTQL